MCSRNLLFCDVSFIRRYRYLLFTPRAPSASANTWSLLLPLLCPPLAKYHAPSHCPPTNQPLPCRCRALPARSRSSVGAGRNPTYEMVQSGLRGGPPRRAHFAYFWCTRERGREALKLARSNELTPELYLCVHNYYKKYVLSQSMDISEHNFRKL